MTFYKVTNNKVVGQAIFPPVGDTIEPDWFELPESNPLVQEWLNPSPLVSPNWNGLYQDLINPTLGLPLYQHIILNSSLYLSVNTAFTVFSLTLTNTRQEEALASALLMLVNSLNENNAALNSNQKETWNELLIRNDFQLGSLFLSI